jgi:hypothetical protein
VHCYNYVSVYVPKYQAIERFNIPRHREIESEHFIELALKVLIKTSIPSEFAPSILSERQQKECRGSNYQDYT